MERNNAYIIVTMTHMALQFEFRSLDEASKAASGLVQAEGVSRIDVFRRHDDEGGPWEFYTPRS